MKIAFDATVVHGDKSGVGYYSEELLRTLARDDGPERYFAFSHRRLTGEGLRPSDRVALSNSGFCRARAVYLHGILPRLLDRESPDLVHYTNFLAPFSSRHPYVVTIHDMSLEHDPAWHPLTKRLYTKRLVPGSADGARLVITNSEFSKWEIVRYLGIPEDRIRVTPLAPSPLFAPPSPGSTDGIRRRYNLDRPFFLYVGNIDPRKNLIRLLEAFSRGPAGEYDLVIAGAEWFGGRSVARAVRRLDLKRAVRFLGYVARNDLPALMAASTAFVYPSLLEGFGIPVLEAMASGAPVITSSTTALGEVAGSAARLVEPRDTEAIADAMMELAEDAGLRRHLVERGFERARAFSWENTANETVAVYHEAVDGGSGDRARRRKVVRRPSPPIDDAVRATCRYAFHFGFPLTPAEVHERLFEVKAEPEEVRSAIERSGLRQIDGFVTASPGDIETRREREQRTRNALERAWPELEFISGFPFVRMVAVSGATAHGNMADEDIDLFAAVEEGRLWFVLAMLTVWFKIRGLRKTICLNYLVSDRALALPDTDLFTAQQAASLKPIYGKGVYDAFIRANPFVFRRFPNFEPDLHRSRYPEIPVPERKPRLERLLRMGPVQLAESVLGRVFRAYLRRKLRGAGPRADVAMDGKRIKLHMRSHREDAMSAVTSPFAADDGRPLAGHAVAGAFRPGGSQRRHQDVEIQQR